MVHILHTSVAVEASALIVFVQPSSSGPPAQELPCKRNSI
jgi:hypothetical protein